MVSSVLTADLALFRSGICTLWLPRVLMIWFWNISEEEEVCLKGLRSLCPEVDAEMSVRSIFTRVSCLWTLRQNPVSHRKLLIQGVWGKDHTGGGSERPLR